MQKTFDKTLSRVSQRGRVVKIIREHYLRDDIYCRSKQCKTCKHDQPVLDKLPPRPKNEAEAKAKKPPVHYVVPTLDVVMHYLDLFELPYGIKNVIFCETITSELQNQNLKRLYNRIK